MSTASSTAAVVLKSRRALPFFAEHPWVFAGAVQRVSGSPEPGAEVAVVTDRDEFIAWGLFNPQSNIQVRLYSWDADVRLDEDFWRQRIRAAVNLRRDVLGLMQPQGAFRLVYSEADGLSGLVVDRYADWLLMQFTSLALGQRRELLARLLQEIVEPQGIWLRTEKGMRAAEGLDIADGLVHGEAPPRPLFIEEHGLRYGLDVVEGQKTGFFVDQRDNRLAAAKYASGKRVLDVCCYTGGFSLNLLRHGNASSVRGVDLSEPALQLARQNAELNGLADKVQFEKGDAFKTLEHARDAGEKYGLIVLDPPKMARQGKAVEGALRGYHMLNRMAIECLEPGGILVTCSCSGHVSREAFEDVLAEAALSAERRVQILELRGAAADHPTLVSCAETNYLKCAICRVE